MSIAELIDPDELKAAVKLINKHKIPSPPETLLKLEKEVSTAAPDVDKIINLVNKDIGLSSSVLNVVNSAQYKLSKEVTSMQHAVKLLGIKQLKNAIIQPAYKRALNQSIEGFENIAEHSNYVGVIATFISEFVNVEGMNDPNLFYLAGLFHDSGTLLLAAEHKDYMDFYEKNEHKSISMVTLEKERYGITHPAIAVLLAKKWGLPAEICNAIYLHHYVYGTYKSKIDSATLAFTESLKLAHALSFMHIIDNFELQKDEASLGYLSAVEELMITEEQLNLIKNDIKNI